MTKKKMKKKRKPPALSRKQKSAILDLLSKNKRAKEAISDIVLSILGSLVLVQKTEKTGKTKKRKKRKKVAKKKAKKAKKAISAYGRKDKRGYTRRVCAKRNCDWKGTVHARTRICPKCEAWNSLKSPK